MLTVACVLRSGGLYAPVHVYRLRDMVAEHGGGHRFVCLTDISVPGIECIPLENDWPGWWAKIELFKPGNLTGRVLYLDLDVTVVGGLDDIAEYPHSFAAIADYQYPLQINSSVMAWDGGTLDHLYENFTPEVMTRLRGDQDWIHERQYAQPFPRAWCPSYRAHVMPSGRIPNGARVVVYHGQPKPWALPDDHLKAA